MFEKVGKREEKKKGMRVCEFDISLIPASPIPRTNFYVRYCCVAYI